MPLPFRPDALHASTAIRAVAEQFFASSPEPFRAAAHALGWGALEGTDWWDVVMDLVG